SRPASARLTPIAHQISRKLRLTLTNLRQPVVRTSARNRTLICWGAERAVGDAAARATDRLLGQPLRRKAPRMPPVGLLRSVAEAAQQSTHCEARSGASCSSSPPAGRPPLDHPLAAYARLDIPRRLKRRAAYMLRRELPQVRRVFREHLWAPAYLAAR